MSNSIQRVMCALVIFLFALGVTRAADFRFREREKAFREECRQQLEKLGITRAAAKSKYPTPEVGLVSPACLLPGGTGEVVIRGKFVPQTKFIFQNDHIEVVKESLTPTEYRATLKAAPGIGPENASVLVIAPVTAITTQRENAALVGGRLEWTMQAANRWKVVARSRRMQACGDGSSSGDPYELAFYRPGENTAFQKTDGTLYFSLWEQTNYRFSISAAEPLAMGGQQEYVALMQQMSDPKLTGAQRDQVMKKLQAAAEQMQANMAKMADPAYMKEQVRIQEEKKQQFGCEQIELKFPGGSSFTGEMRCSDKVGRQLAITGAVTALK